MSLTPASRFPGASRLFPFVVGGVAGAAAGWLLHTALAPAPAGIPTSFPVSPRAVVPAVAVTSANAAARVSPQAALERALRADSTDMVNLVEALGALTNLDDAGVKLAWESLGRRTPADTMGGSAGVIYLWSRLVALGGAVEIPPGWGAEHFAATIELAKVRQGAPRLLARLAAGENLSEAERRAVFTDTMRTDPLGAVRLWVASTKPWDYRGDARWLGDALSSPDTRDAVMTELRRWQKGGDLGGATLALAWDWIARDPVAVERWLQLPEQADVRGTVMQQVANVRVLANPAEAWTWSEALPSGERVRILGMGAGQLANQDPEAGARLVAGLRDPAERQEAVRQYGKVLAANNLEQWKTWRDTLPETERAFANESGFDLWVYHEPEQALQWLNTQPEGATKDRMIATVVNVYASRDPKVAADWIESIPDPARRKEAAITALASIGPSNLDSMRTILDAAKD